AGFPEDVFRTAILGSRHVSHLIAHPRIRAVTFTGSTPAGRSVAQECAKGLKKAVLELGGSDPYVILEDADLEPTIESCVTSRLINAGQSCIAAKRFIVVEAIADAFEKGFLEKLKT